MLSTGAASGPGGTGTGVDNEYLFIWQLSAALPVYTFDFSAREASLSLEALSVENGPARLVTVPTLPPVIPPVIVPPPATVVPLPPAAHLSIVATSRPLTSIACDYSLTEWRTSDNPIVHFSA